MLVLTLLLAAISVAEAMAFRETGLRKGHGNFNWAGMSAALMLWVLMLSRFFSSFSVFRKSESRPWHRWVGFGVGFGLLGWHVYSGFYYLYFLLSTGNAF